VFGDFAGSVQVVPPLNSAEAGYLERFSDTRRMRRRSGPYTAEPFDPFAPDRVDVLDVNEPPEGQPGLWCEWAASPDGREIAWNHRTGKFTFAADWLEYLIAQFLAPGARLAAELAIPVPGRYYAPEFGAFTFDHVLNGAIEVVPDEEDWEHTQIVVRDNRVTGWLLD
jgi:hypothetical protein